MQSTGDIAAFRIGRCVPNKLKEREALPSNLRLQEPSYLGNEQQMYGAYHVAEALYLTLRKESQTILKCPELCVYPRGSILFSLPREQQLAKGLLHLRQAETILNS